MTLRAIWVLFYALALPTLVFGCERVGGAAVGPTTGPTATSSPTTSPTPSACNTPDAANTKLVIVGMASGFVATTDPLYGNIAGYAVIDLTGASPSPIAATIIDKTVAGTSITSQNTVQFVNLEPSGSTILHSAVGFAGAAFPAKPFAFPSPLASPTASAVSTSAPWSTGLIAAPATMNCFSQEFTLKPGTYYFGDLTYYNITTFQDVLVVSP